MQTALVTGASSGIGRHLAREFARRRHPLVVVAPVQAELEALAEELRTEFGVDARILAAGLEQADAVQRLCDVLEADAIAVEILVNDARHGQEANLMAPRDVAAAGCRAVMNGERLAVPGRMNKLTVFSRRFMSDAMQAKVYRKMYEESPPGERKRARGDREDRHAHH